MLITTVNRRYAKALLDFAREQDKVEEVRNDVDQILRVLRDSREFRVMLKSPVIGSDKKNQIMEAVFEGRITEITAKFIGILIAHGREGTLEETMISFNNQYRSLMGIEEAVITTAHALSEEQRNEISEKLSEITSKKMEIIEKVDPSLIGGLKVRVGDRQYNGSVAAQLAQLRRNFKKNEFVSEL